jgi:metal-dependent amidase/aminoacylase/carboxypeptidase family protein
MLLAAAQHFAQRGDFLGTLNLIFQPAEENGGGALKMMDDSLFEKSPCDAIFAMHNMPGVPQGRLVLREGAAMASSDDATVMLTGVGGHGVMAQIDWRPSYAVLFNTPTETALAREIALALVGAEQVTLQGPAVTGSEDFAFMLERVPGSYLLIGNGDGNGAGACMVHNPGYDFNDANLSMGAAYWVLLAQRFWFSRRVKSSR